MVSTCCAELDLVVSARKPAIIRIIASIKTLFYLSKHKNL